SLIMGFLFGVALLLTGMCNPLIILGFLNFAGSEWNPQLLLVCVGCMIPNMIAFRYVATLKQPPYLLRQSTSTVNPTSPPKNICEMVPYGLHHPKNTKMEWRLVVGAMIFGFGWALSGICPG